MSEDGFLSRWSRRKQAVREGQPLQAEPPVPPAVPAVPAVPAAHASAAAPAAGEPQTAPVDEPPPTLDEAERLEPGADVSRFVQADVPPDVKNTALRKLFADPHFNRMDGLDVYIDDYGKPDPMPPAMLRQLASAQFLKLFDEEEKEAAKDGEAKGKPDHSGTPAVAQSQPSKDSPSDADPDLRLQQDHAPGRESPGEGPE